MIRPQLSSTLFPYTTLFRSRLSKEFPDKFHVVIATDDQIMPINSLEGTGLVHTAVSAGVEDFRLGKKYRLPDRKSTRLNSSHLGISYAVFCLKKKIKQ